MKEENKKILSEYRMRKAIETLKDAKIIFEDGYLHSCVNRIYYAVFYAVNAVLIRQGMYSTKHSGVKSLLHKEFVKTGIIPEKFGDFYTNIFKMRNTGDYEDFTEFKKKEVKGWLKEAEIFIEEIKKVIKNVDAGTGFK